MEEAGLVTYTSHQVVIKTLWLHCQGAVIPSIFIYSLSFNPFNQYTIEFRCMAVIV